MICKNCGYQCGNEKFCPNCKSPLSPHFLKRHKIWIFAIAAAIMVLTGILVTKPKPDSSRTPYVLELETEPIRFWNFYDHSDEYINWFIAVKPDGSVMELPDTVNYWAKEFSLNRKTAYWIDRNHVLYIITKNGCEKIADNVVCANISDTGNRIVYCVNDNLYLYDIA